MKNQPFFLSILALALTLTLSLGFASASLAGNEEDAAIAAKKWLAIVDSGDYGRSWDAASPVIQNAVSKEQFVSGVKGVRVSFGALKSRTLIGAQYMESLPGAPDGRYVVMQFRTSFANKASAIETITPKEDGGVWLVSGYYIK